jgi:hypothetical protein
MDYIGYSLIQGPVLITFYGYIAVWLTDQAIQEAA